ncbi:hypothetical protein [Halobacillus faecis]|nr:hypothetical protein [Halobacillus faecis]
MADQGYVAIVYCYRTLFVPYGRGMVEVDRTHGVRPTWMGSLDFTKRYR